MHPFRYRQPQKASQPKAAATRRRKRALETSMPGPKGKFVAGAILLRRPLVAQARQAEGLHQDLPWVTVTWSRAGVGRAQGLVALQFAAWPGLGAGATA